MKYWHLQMHLPWGRNEEEIDPKEMLNNQHPFIGIHEWDDKQYYDFVDLELNTIVMVRKGNQPIALCKIISNHYKDKELEAIYLHTDYRDVKVLGWAKDYPMNTPANLFSQGTFKSCKDTTQQFKYINDWLNYIKRNETMTEALTILNKKNNIILQGAPGTGKTYSTTSLAVGLINPKFNNFDDRTEVISEYNQLLIKIDSEQNNHGDKSKGIITSGQIGFITFHQSMEYEDFIEGIKPVSKGETVSYVIENGIFKMMAKKAASDRAHKYVLIIDEINRGNISKILGELITLLEPDKRDDKENRISVTLPYSKESFSVPSNLYIIGTMNTTDRSVGTVDYAIRRRFAFVTLKSHSSIVETKSSKMALDLFNAVQTYIEDNKEPELDIEDLKIGHSYFLVNNKDNGDELEQRWKYEILPLLREYYRDGIILKDIPENCRSIEAFESFVHE